jgi:hypothetical protein
VPPNGRLCGGGGPDVAEGEHHLLCEAVEVFELSVERRRADDAVGARIALLDLLQRLDDVLRPAGEEAAGLIAPSIGWWVGERPRAGLALPVLPVLSGRDQALATPSIANARPLAGPRCA